MATKKAAAKKSPVKKTTAKKTTTKKAAVKKAPAKKTTTKKTTAKKAPAKKATQRKKESAMSKLQVGDGVLVHVNPRQNNGSNVAGGLVTKVDDEAVNLRVFLDSEETLWLTNVAVASKKPDEGEDQRVCWPA